MFKELQQYLPILIPLVVIGLIVIAVTLLDLKKQTATRGPKWMWVLVIFFIQIFGPIAYYVIGRKEE
jgi:hypothetical protein